jgi:hypothetical protein
MNTTLLATVILTILVLAFFVTALGIKMLFDKKAAFKGGCASNNPMFTNEIGECMVCGRNPDVDCDVAEGSDLPTIGR